MGRRQAERVLRQWRIRVYTDHDHPDYPKDYYVRAVDEMDARLMAYLMDDGTSGNEHPNKVEDHDVALCQEYTQVIARS